MGGMRGAISLVSFVDRFCHRLVIGASDIRPKLVPCRLIYALSSSTLEPIELLSNIQQITSCNGQRI